MSTEDEERLNAYRAALISLCDQNGGRLFVKTPEFTPPGTIMWHWVPDGIEFRSVPDGAPH